MVASAVDLLAITEGETRLKKVASTDGGEKHPLLVTASKPIRTRRECRPLVIRRCYNPDPERCAAALARLLAALASLRPNSLIPATPEEPEVA